MRSVGKGKIELKKVIRPNHIAFLAAFLLEQSRFVLPLLF